MAPRRPPVSSGFRGFGWEPGTMRKAGVVAAGLLLVLGGGAWMLTEPTVKGPLSPYVRHGATAGAAAMQRDLMADFPLGNPVSPLVQRLQQLGLRCVPPPPGPATWRCNARLQAMGQEQMLVEVVIGSTNDRLMSLDVGFTRQTPP